MDRKYRSIFLDFQTENYRNLRNRFHLILSGNFRPASVESQMTTGLPTMWSSGTKPQYLESRELCLLSPIMK